MTAAGGLPYEECRRWQRENRTPRDRTATPWPAYALPPFRPDAHGPRDDAAPRPGPPVSGVLRRCWGRVRRCFEGARGTA